MIIFHFFISTSWRQDDENENVPNKRWASDISQLLGETKVNSAKARSFREINLMGCKQHSLVPINRQSSQATLISRCRHKQRYHTALPSQPTLLSRRRDEEKKVWGGDVSTQRGWGRPANDRCHHGWYIPCPAMWQSSSAMRSGWCPFLLADMPV